MALAHAHVSFLLEAAARGCFPYGIPAMLEFGEQEWFGDIGVSDLPRIAALCQRDPGFVAWVQQQSLVLNDKSKTFEVAKLFYQIIFGIRDYLAIDLHGTQASLPYDLNHPVSLDRRFEVTTNIGTAEHIFNQAQFFRNMHDLTLPGGIMYHALPNQGCYDHGFYNYHPTFLFDLCAANSYQILMFSYVDSSVKPSRLVPIASREAYVEMALESRLSAYSGLMLLARRTTDGAFVVPQQAYYGTELSPALREAWSKLDR